MWWRSPHDTTAYDDGWEDQPGQGWFYQWVLGVALPAALAAYGVRAVVLRSAVFGNQQPMLVHGVNAVALGVAALSAGAFVHFHYFWGNVYDQAWWAVLEKIIGAAGFIAGMAILIVRVGVLGANQAPVE